MSLLERLKLALAAARPLGPWPLEAERMVTEDVPCANPFCHDPVGCADIRRRRLVMAWEEEARYRLLARAN